MGQRYVARYPVVDITWSEKIDPDEVVVIGSDPSLTLTRAQIEHIYALDAGVSEIGGSI